MVVEEELVNKREAHDCLGEDTAVSDFDEDSTDDDTDEDYLSNETDEEYREERRRSNRCLRCFTCASSTHL